MFRFSILLCGVLLHASSGVAQESPASPPGLDRSRVEERLEGDFGSADIAAATSWADSLGLADWLGPLAPVALSPFFGVTCLSGLAIWGPDWATDNALLGASGPLQNHSLFFVFLALTVLTSLPRLTKVSKPFAQATDRLETYAVIVILLAIKVIASLDSPGEDQTEVVMVQLGVVRFTVDTLLAVAMVINVLVINSVKFFFEFMVWLTPIPAIDAIFEFCNKSLCVTLMAVYAFSPTIATILNLAILLVAAIVLRWVSRHIRYYRTMVLDPVVSRVWSAYGDPKHPEMVVFCKGAFGPFAAKSRLRLRRDELGQGWQLREANWWMPGGEHALDETAAPRIRRGWVMHTIEVTDSSGQTTEFAVSRRYDLALQTLAKRIGILVDEQPAAQPRRPTEAAVEFN
ncbi:hypothetical protein [Novipirellula artificiosorum]|uniref:Uncharacterized protein n=1 Tax=Novipirellula artificiosorum TaxID=2528016 RepID=A0A5C6E4E1_9BACT|nr:hypothetical protein [Novipirellula artificiosorum]TWU42857.1 hypothetical protein Poly41_11580 [Novipirellula artificiosorum]